jgi:hypothetical protein
MPLDIRNEKLLRVPMVRRIEYLLDYLQATERRCSKEEIEEILSERKRQFEREKILAVGRGNPFRKNIGRTSNLVSECLKLSKALGLVGTVDGDVTVSNKGRVFLATSDEEKMHVFSEAYSEAYPHLATLALTLSHQVGEEAVLPLQNKPAFRPQAEKVGLIIGQVAFDVVRDIATMLGIVNWYSSGGGVERRQHVYLACKLVTEPPDYFSVRIHWRRGWLYVVPRAIERSSFRNALWSVYLEAADGIPGSPVFYSAVREKVCATLKIRDRQFDEEVLRMVESDDVYRVVWSEGVLPYQRDSASMFKSLPPKTEDGNYIVYLKMTRR